MAQQTQAKLERVETRADGGANVYFSVRFGDYLVKVPVTLEPAEGRDLAGAGKEARARFAAMAADLAGQTRRWLG